MYVVAVTLKPDLAGTHTQLASTYKDTRRIPDAVVHYQKALQLNPGDPDALCNLVHTNIFISDWRDYEVSMKLLEQCLDSQLAQGQLPAIQPFHAFVYPISLVKLKHLAVAYAKRAEKVAIDLLTRRQPTAADAGGGPPYRHPPADGTLGTASDGPRLRIGYVSSDFINHPLAHLMQSVFKYHDRSRFEIFCYSLRPSDHSPSRTMIERGACARPSALTERFALRPDGHAFAAYGVGRGGALLRGLAP